MRELASTVTDAPPLKLSPRQKTRASRAPRPVGAAQLAAVGGAARGRRRRDRARDLPGRHQGSSERAGGRLTARSRDRLRRAAVLRDAVLSAAADSGHGPPGRKDRALASGVAVELGCGSEGGSPGVRIHRRRAHRVAGLALCAVVQRVRLDDHRSWYFGSSTTPPEHFGVMSQGTFRALPVPPTITDGGATPTIAW
jgi:hypothetical protein